MNYRLIVDKELCSGCGNCVVVCPVNAMSSIELSSGKGTDFSGLDLDLGIEDGVARVIDEEVCTGCGNCITTCCYNAVTLDAIKPSETEKMLKVKEMELPGDGGRVYKAIKENGPLKISEIAKAVEMSNKEVYIHVLSLKKDSRIWEHSIDNGEYLYTTEIVEREEVEEGVKAVLPKIDPEIARKFRERLNNALVSLDGVRSVKIRSLIESDKLDEAREVIKKKNLKGGKGDS